MDPIISLVLWNLIAFSLCSMASALSSQPVAWRWVLAAIVLFNINVAFVLDLFRLNSALYTLIGRPDLEYNWAGKIIALSFSIALLAFGLFKWREIGGTLAQAKGAWIGWGVVIALSLFGVGLGLYLPDEHHSAETIAYQLTMPSLEEEIFYRGIFLYCLVRAFGQGPRFAASNFGYAALISTVVFTMIHSVFWDQSGFFFALDAFLFAGVFSVLLTWLRLNTGSLLAPILMHSAINTLWRLF